MRKYIDIAHRLVEGWLARVDPNGDFPTDVYIDPSRGEIARMLRGSKEHVLRAALGKHLYVWDAYGFVHSYLPADIVQPGDEGVTLPASQRDDTHVTGACFMIDQHGPYFPAQDHEVAPDGEDDPDVDPAMIDRANRLRAFCDGHPMMHRAFGPAVRITFRNDALR